MWLCELCYLYAYNGDNIPANTAELNRPVDVALDAAGKVYIADAGTARIRKVTANTGIITTVAGNGVGMGTIGIPGYSCDACAATSSELDTPDAVAVDAEGNLYIADATAELIRKVTASTGIINTVIGSRR